MWTLKKKWFTGLSDLTIVTPSEWLAGLVKQSFLSEYPVRVINNGIDLGTFHPTNGGMTDRYGLMGHYIVLGVASPWCERKGLDIFLWLANELDDRFQIVLVGTDAAVEKTLPKSVLAVRRTESKEELAALYTAADVFVNPTREDTFPTVNIEALACGTPVVTFSAGGSPEIPDGSCGVAVDREDREKLKEEIIRVCEQKPFLLEDCQRRAERFSEKAMTAAYIRLYEEVSGTRKNEEY